MAISETNKWNKDHMTVDTGWILRVVKTGQYHKMVKLVSCYQVRQCRPVRSADNAAVIMHSIMGLAIHVPHLSRVRVRFRVRWFRITVICTYCIYHLFHHVWEKPMVAKSHTIRQSCSY